MDVALQFGHTLFLDRHVGTKTRRPFFKCSQPGTSAASEIVFDGKKRAGKLFPDIHDPEQFAAELFWPRAIALGHGREPLTPTRPRPPRIQPMLTHWPPE